MPPLSRLRRRLRLRLAGLHQRAAAESGRGSKRAAAEQKPSSVKESIGVFAGRVPTRAHHVLRYCFAMAT
jgi:hypothetical protein